MSNDLPEYLGADGIRLAVVRNDQQFQRALQDVTVMAGKKPVDDLMQTNPDAALRRLPPGTMGVFIVVPKESPNWPLESTYSPTQRRLEILHTPKPFDLPSMVDYALMPKGDKPLQLVTQSDAGRASSPVMMFELSADSLTGRRGANDPVMMLADMVMGALAASAVQRSGKQGGPMGAPAGLDVLAQMLMGGGDEGTQWNPQNAQTVVKLGRGLMKEYPNTMFCGVGNSPSYLIYAMEKASANDNKPVDVRYIPFSGRFLGRGRQNKGKLVYGSVDPVDFRVYEHHKDAYRSRLTDMGLSPQQIVARHQDQGTRTAFIDNTQSGTSFMSFNTVMRLWARDQGVEKKFKDAAPVIALADSDCNVAPVNGRVSIPTFNIDLQARVVRIPHALRLAMNSNYSCESDRFVPEYPFDAWGRNPADVSKRNGETIAAVKAMIDEAATEGGVKPTPTPTPEPARGIGSLIARLRRGHNSDPHS